MPVVLSRKGGGASGGGAPSGPAGGDLSGTYPNPTIDSGAAASGEVLTSDGAGGTTFAPGGGWTNSFTESGASLSNWTQDSGTWSIVSSALRVDTTGGTTARLRFNTTQGLRLNTMYVFQAEMKMEAAGVGSNAPMGLLSWWDGTGSGDPTAQLYKEGAGAGTKRVRGELDATANIMPAFTPDPTWAFDTFTKLTVVGKGLDHSVLLNDVLVGAFVFDTTQKSMTFDPFVGLICNNAVCHFQNIRLDYLPLPA